MQALGAELAITYLNAKAEPYMRPLAVELQSQPDHPALQCGTGGLARGDICADCTTVGRARFFDTFLYDTLNQ